MKCEQHEVDSLDYDNFCNGEDLFLDSLEPSTFRGTCDNTATQSSQPPSVVELSGEGYASANAALARHACDVFSARAVRLRGCGLPALPPHALALRSLTHLDLSDNRISQLPDEISQLTQLEDLQVKGNQLRSLRAALRLPRLRVLNASHNYLADFDGTDMNSEEKHREDERTTAPLTDVDLRHNKLKGSIILGNYESLVSLDVSHNDVETLCVSALRALRDLRAANNRLRSLALHGAALRTLDVSHNQIETISTTSTPVNLTVMDVSHNKLSYLPHWLASTTNLSKLDASNNQISCFPVLGADQSNLHTVNLAHNKISTISTFPKSKLPWRELLLYDNCIEALPGDFFSVCEKLNLLNLSNNRLSHIPCANNSRTHCIKYLYLTANCLTDESLDTLMNFHKLKILHVAYNCLTSFPDDCIRWWPDMEELILSGNSISKLPENLPQYNNLKVVRAHSNKLMTVPMFVASPTIKVLDFANNELDSVDLRLLAPKQLKFLDISCNKRLQMNAKHFSTYTFQRPISLIDVTGRNETTWPHRNGYHEETSTINPWNVGFSECPDKSLQLYCTQIRLPTYCSREGLFAIIDGETDNEVPKLLQSCLPSLVLEEKSVKETANDYMKYVILSAHRELKERGQKNGACVLLCHISAISEQEHGFGIPPKRYHLRLANVGNAQAVLYRQSGPLSIGVENQKRLGYSSRYPNTVPDPDTIQTIIKEDDEFLILANGKFWKNVSVENAVSEVRAEKNPILAAKKLQDLAQSYGVDDSLSIIVVRFSRGKSDVDMLMRELRQTISSNKSICRSDCCCTRLEACYHSAGSAIKSNSDRSSPSGQSDRPPSETISHQHYASVRSQNHRASERRACLGGVARAIRVRVEEDKEEELKNEDLPEQEQYKCWEYMLEQNTQMLFDKELDNLSKGIRSNASGLKHLRGLSGSSPQLHGNSKQSKMPFLSKHFGSARSFGNNLKTDFRFGSGRIPNGGPNAAYFGSLQRLMPYNLEYDFAVIQEKGSQPPDSLELENRMQQYWGVTTTEL